MTEAERKEFLTMIADVYAFYRQDFSRFAGNVWWAALRHYDLSAVTDAIGRHAVNPDAGQYLPKPADIVKMLQGSSQDASMVAWSKVDKAVRQVGTYASVVFDDPLIHRVVHDMGGWVALGQKEEREWPFVAKEFETRYRGYRARSDSPEHPAHLIGIAEAHNAQNGQRSQPPVLIGNSDAAKRVMLNGSSNALVGFTRMSEAEMLSLAAPSQEVA